MKTRVYVSVIVKNKENKQLIIRRHENSIFAPGQWEFVNGSIDDGESAEQTAVRELQEETGIIIREEDLKEGPVHELTDSDGRWVVIPYFLQVKTQEVNLSPEHTDYNWVSEQELLTTANVGKDYEKLLELLS
jgi:8-oxo-dGTP diphosphatase